MPTSAGSKTLSLALDPDNGEVVARLNGRKLFDEPLFSNLRGSILLLPPEAGADLDIIVTRPAR